LQSRDLLNIYETIKELKLKRVIYDNKINQKTKIEVGFIDMVRGMQNRELQQAKLSDPFNKIVDI
jgi:hypothetical protein